jgi:hypothetical protein
MNALANLIGSPKGFALCCGVCVAGITALLLCLALV